MAITVSILLPPGVKGDGVIEDIEKDGVPIFLFLCVVGSSPYGIASRAGEGEIRAHYLPCARACDMTYM